METLISDLFDSLLNIFDIEEMLDEICEDYADDIKWLEDK